MSWAPSALTETSPLQEEYVFAHAVIPFAAEAFDQSKSDSSDTDGMSYRANLYALQSRTLQLVA